MANDYGRPVQKVLCVDVDGVLANNEDLSVEYYDRDAYPQAVEFLKRARASGFYIKIQTARGMERFDSNLKQIEGYHYCDLKAWLIRHDVPFDEIHFGKVAATYYLDDNAVRIESRKGSEDWDLLAARLGVCT